MLKDNIRTKEELEKIADLMLAEATKHQGEEAVLRYHETQYDTKKFDDDKVSSGQSTDASFNKELMTRGQYSVTPLRVRLGLYPEMTVARDLVTHRFNFKRKEIPLPSDKTVKLESIPDNFDKYDSEFREFSKNNEGTNLARMMEVDTQIIVNSNGGVSIQQIPTLSIRFNYGLPPVVTSRTISVVCRNDEDMGRLPKLIKYLADPTPDRRVANSRNFSDAFTELVKISRLKYGSLEDAGIKTKELYNVVMLTGVPIHEIFGHHFEEPIRYLDFGESGTFKHGQTIQNKDLTLTDNPLQEIEGFNVLGFTHFDAYGRFRPPRVHITEGKVFDFLGGEYQDPTNLKSFLNLETSQFVGNSTQFNDGYFPQPRMSCTHLEGKSEKIDLEGKILMVTHEGHTDPSDKTYNVNGYECYVIKNGIPERIIPLKVTGGINQALANITLLPEWSYQTGFCGKPEPIYYPQSRGYASAPVSQVTRNQLWTGQQVYPLPISDRHLKILQR